MKGYVRCVGAVLARQGVRPIGCRATATAIYVLAAAGHHWIMNARVSASIWLLNSKTG